MKNYRTLDALVVLGALVILAFVAWALVFRVVPQPNLPILAGLVGTIFGGTVGAYAGARWGNKKADEPTPGTLTTTTTATPPTGGTSVQQPSPSAITVTHVIDAPPTA